MKIRELLGLKYQTSNKTELLTFRLPEIVQKALPQTSGKGLTATTTSVDYFQTEMSTRWIVKREAGTMDPILANIFPVNIYLNCHLKKQATIKLFFIQSLESTTQLSAKTPKPKPIFTDARKLDNSRDWENVKIPKPPKVRKLPYLSSILLVILEI